MISCKSQKHPHIFGNFQIISSHNSQLHHFFNTMSTTFQNLDSFDLNKFISGALDHDFLIPVSVDEWDIMLATDVELDARLHELRGLEE